MLYLQFDTPVIPWIPQTIIPTSIYFNSKRCKTTGTRGCKKFLDNPISPKVQ